MADPDAVFSTEEVNALVPRLEALIARLHTNARRLQVEREALGGCGALPSMETVLRECPLARRLVEEMDAAANEIASLGGQLKDLSLGLVDFRGVHGGEPVLLCWQYGEPEVAFWHRDDEGFAGRKRLPGRHQDPRLQ